MTMEKLIFLLSISLGHSTALGHSLPEGTWKNEHVKVEVTASEIIVNSHRFLVEQEVINDSYLSSSRSTDKGSGCVIRSNHAADRGSQMVLLSAARSKIVDRKLGKISCGFTRSSEGFENPFRYQLFVLSRLDDDAIEMKVLDVNDQPNRPNLTVAQLLDPSSVSLVKTEKTGYARVVLKK
ncbi:MAG: hypothetical protein K2Q26_05630 [Bdellovibrionales bacterium]|nr:hypothetical protein [Bdellovibrionales bacterium]